MPSRKERAGSWLNGAHGALGYLLGLLTSLLLTLIPTDLLKTHLRLLLVVAAVIALLIVVITHLRRRHPVGEDLRRASGRQQFAEGLRFQVGKLSQAEQWSDERFTDLEAEVEVDGQTRRRRGRRSPGLRSIVRVPSLTKALSSSTDRLVLLEGEPGSGKSVALRHVALELADDVTRAPDGDKVIPLYVNLKEFLLPDGARPDATAVHTFVLDQVGRSNISAHRYLEANFDDGLRDGTWLFLFDSFDEIPAILSSTENDDVVEQYSAALVEFATDMNACRTVVASRDFKSPSRRQWTRMRIQRLTPEQRRTLLQRLNLSEEAEARLLATLADPASGTQEMSENPLFLALLAQLVSDTGDVPATRHAALEHFVDQRLHADTHRLAVAYGITPHVLRRFAERAAAAMSATAGLGLTPSSQDLRTAMDRLGLLDGLGEPDFETALDALAYLRLARREGDAARNLFTFSHPRFQEYFTTCYLLQAPDRVTPESLLTDWQWRETAVTVFQTQAPGAHEPLLDRARSLLTDYVLAAEADWEHITASAGPVAPTDPAAGDEEGPTFTGPDFPWPPGSLHLLRLLGDGFAAGAAQLPDDVRDLAGRLLRPAFFESGLRDARWACEVCHVGPQDLALDVVKDALGSKSPWLREAGFAQAGRLRTLTPDIRDRIAGALRRLTAGGRLNADADTVRAQLKRLPDPQPFLADLRLLLTVGWVEVLLWGLLFIAAVAALRPPLTASALPVYTFLLAATAVGAFSLVAIRDALRFDDYTRSRSALRPAYGPWEFCFGRPTSEAVVMLGFLIRGVCAASVLVSVLNGPGSWFARVTGVALTGIAFVWGIVVLLPELAVGPRPTSVLQCATYPLTVVRRRMTGFAAGGSAALAGKVLRTAWELLQYFVVIGVAISLTTGTGVALLALAFMLAGEALPRVDPGKQAWIFAALAGSVVAGVFALSVTRNVREARRVKRALEMPSADWTDQSLLEALSRCQSASSFAQLVRSLQRDDVATLPAVGAIAFLAKNRNVLRRPPTLLPKNATPLRYAAVMASQLWKHRRILWPEDTRRQVPSDWTALGYRWTTEQTDLFTTWLGSLTQTTLAIWADPDVQDELARLSGSLTEPRVTTTP